MARKKAAPTVTSVRRGLGEITPTDDVELAEEPRAIWVGTTGDIAMILADDPPDAAPTVYPGVTGGQIHSFSPRVVAATGTTAEGIFGLA